MDVSISQTDLNISENIIDVTMSCKSIHVYDNCEIIYGEIIAKINTPDEIKIDQNELFSKEPTNIIIGASDAIALQHIMCNSPPNKTGIKLISPSGTIIMRSNAGNSQYISNVVPNGEIKQLSNIKFSDEKSIVVLGNNSIPDFYKCKLPSTKKSLLLIDLQRLIKKFNTKDNIILVISDELLKIINSIDINLNEYFNLVINFPANDLILCLDEMINGKIIKSIDEKFELTIDIGATNTILTSVFSPNTLTSNVVQHIGTRGRMRFVSNHNQFNTTFIIIVKVVESIIFNSDSTDTILNISYTTDNDITTEYLTTDNLNMCIQLAIDNDFNELIVEDKVTNDMLGNLLINYIIRNSTLSMFNTLFSTKIESDFILLIKQLVTNLLEINTNMLVHLIKTTNMHMIQNQHNNDKTGVISRVYPPQRQMHRYTSSAMTNPINYSTDSYY